MALHDCHHGLKPCSNSQVTKSAPTTEENDVWLDVKHRCAVQQVETADKNCRHGAATNTCLPKMSCLDTIFNKCDICNLQLTKFILKTLQYIHTNRRLTIPPLEMRIQKTPWVDGRKRMKMRHETWHLAVVLYQLWLGLARNRFHCHGPAPCCRATTCWHAKMIGSMWRSRGKETTLLSRS